MPEIREFCRREVRRLERVTVPPAYEEKRVAEIPPREIVFRGVCRLHCAP